MLDRHDIKQQVLALLSEPSKVRLPESLLSLGPALFPVLEDLLQLDLPFSKAEALESILKQVLTKVLAEPVSGNTARTIALFQKSHGFIFKYKSYGIKAATSLGYSNFLLDQQRGFSFQQHVVHKTEVFHILHTHPGGYVFISDLPEWRAHYTSDRIAAWLAGNPDSFFDKHKFVPQPGDVFIIKDLNIVHTAIGCILEEFATVSTDMVDRLHDQNRNAAIPGHFSRAYAAEQLRGIHLPSQHRLVNPQDWTTQPLLASQIDGHRRTVLTDSFVGAYCSDLDPTASTAISCDPTRDTVIRVYDGKGNLSIAETSELDYIHTLGIPAASGDVFLVPKHIHYCLRNLDTTPLRWSEHHIAHEIAFT